MSGFTGTFEQLLESITPEVHQNLKRAVELGRWANGERLRPEQVDLCLQAIIAYEARNLPPEQRVAYIDRNKKQGSTPCGN